MVVALHASWLCMPQRMGVVEAGSFEWYGMALYRTIFASPTVLFVMVSGIFFLTPERNVTPRKIWTKNVPKMTCAYIFWCLIYALYRIYQMDPQPEFTFKLLVQQWLIEPDHLWYIPMIVTLYILVPFFRCVTKIADKKLYKYMLMLFVPALVLNTIATTPHLVYGGYLNTILGKTPLETICTYGFWMIYGYFMYTYRPSPKARKIIYVLGVISAIAAFIICIVTYHTTGYWHAAAVNRKFTITTFGKNTAIFVFITNHFSQIQLSDRGKKILGKVSGCTLMIYLAHWLFLEIFFDHNFIFSWGINPWIVVWIYAIVIYAIGIAMALIFQLVPWKKLRKQIWGKITGNTESK